jgi:CRP-like cAMP-binding protein
MSIIIDPDLGLNMPNSSEARGLPTRLQALIRQYAEAQGTPIQLTAGELLFRINDRSDGVYLIEQGSISVSIDNRSGDRIELARLNAGELIGEMSLLGESTRSASCSAGEKGSHLLFLDREQTLQLIDVDNQARQEFLTILSERARTLVRFIHDFSHLTALVANNDYIGVQTLLNSGGGEDATVKGARDAFRNMLTRIQQREAELQTRISSLNLEIDQRRAAEEVESIVGNESFRNLRNNADDLRRRLREQ